MTKKQISLSKALKWWKQQVINHNIVLSSNDFPSSYIRSYLLHRGFAGKIRNGIYLLKKPEDDLKHQIFLFYFKIVQKILLKYKPWSIKGISALDIYLGTQKISTKLHVRTAKKVNYSFKLKYNLTISIIYDPHFNKSLVKPLLHLGEKINIDIPEKVLFDMKKMGKKEIQFLKSQKLDYRVLDFMYMDDPSPVTFRKLCKILPKLGQQNLAEEMKNIVERYTFYESINIEPVSDKTLILPPQKPWVLRQSDQIKHYLDILDKKFKKRLQKFPTFPIKSILEHAEKNKQYDIYHSTTIEGYHITPEDVSKVLFSHKKHTKNEKDITNTLAILGYKEAFDYVLKVTQNDFRKTLVTEKLVQDIIFHLFRPSVRLNIIDKFQLIRYRTIQNYIRGSRHIPPSPDKVLDLMENLELSIKQIKNPIIKAILVHYLFATIHPYMDGNGRTARLLMNYVLCSSGYKWITIRAEDRQQYFSALETAQVDDDILPFATFVLELRNLRS